MMVSVDFQSDLGDMRTYRQQMTEKKDALLKKG